MGATREGESVYSHSSNLNTRYGQLVQGVDDNEKVRFLSLTNNGSAKNTIVDGSGNLIDAHPDADGDYHMGVSLIQSIITSTNNSTTTNLASGSTFTGVVDETFGINGIQLFHSADQDCTIYIDQSIDDTFPAATTLTDSFDCLANTPCSRTLTSVSPYYRLRVTNNGASATTSLASFTGMTPIINPLPRALSEDERLKSESTLVGRENTNRHAFISPYNSLNVNQTTRLAGTSFDGTTKDTNFWSETGTANGGSVTQGGAEVTLASGTASNGAAVYQTIVNARYVVGRPLRLIGYFALTTAPVANNLRRIGAYSATDGFFFQMNGTTFQIGHRKGSTDTLISNGSFNGNYGPSWNAEVGEIYYRLEIEYGSFGVAWYIDGQLLHKLDSGHYSNTLTLPVRMENINSGSTTNSEFDCLGAAISAQGELQTQPITRYAGTGGLSNATHVLKYGAGKLHRVTVTDNSGTLLVYDGLSAAGTLIANFDASKTVGTMELGAPFSIGLTVVVAGTPKMTIVYE